ncbi:DUF397 domain-containing protein [Actinocorallia longicatena]|uniref:DUF397 domain-containing protein n=1 Tax=Actinocorallia longicatena TaxID=111803 RepID=A0ABP6Q0L8_9ACTN
MTTWRKSSHSNTTGGDCVEVAKVGGNVRVRDSKFPGGGDLVLRVEGFARVVAGLRGE